MTPSIYDPMRTTEKQRKPSSPSTFFASGTLTPDSWFALAVIEIKEPHSPKWQNPFLPTAWHLDLHVAIIHFLPSSSTLSPFTQCRLSIVKSVVFIQVPILLGPMQGLLQVCRTWVQRRCCGCPVVCRSCQSPGQENGVFPPTGISLSKMLGKSPLYSVLTTARKPL